MSYASINTRAQLGLAAPSVSVEVHLSNGLPCFSIVGLPERQCARVVSVCGPPWSIVILSSQPAVLASI